MTKLQLTNWITTELFDKVPLLISIIDRKFNLVLANKNFEREFGKAIGKKCYTVYKDRKRKCTKCMAKLTFEDGLTHIDNEIGTNIYGRDNQYIIHTIPIKEKNNVSYVMEISTDVTEINQLKYNYHQLFEQVPCYVAIIDRNFRIIHANEKFRTAFGEKINKPCYQVWKKRDIKCENCPAERSFSDGKPHHSELVGISKEGKRINYLLNTAPLKNESGKIEQIIEISIDITEMHSLKNEISSLHNFQDNLINNAPIGIIATDNKNRIILFNPEAQRMFGYEESEILGRTKTKNFFPNDYFETIKKNGTSCIINETEIISKTKKKIPVSFSGVILHKDNKILGNAAMFQDLTELKVLEQKKLEAERMAAVGHTVAGLAHGVKNILTGLQGGMFIMNEGINEGNASDLLHGWDILKRNIEKITIFVKDFLNFSKGEKPRVKYVNPVKIVNDVVGLYYDIGRQTDIELISEIDEKISNAFFDPDALHNCMTNIISNAIDACQLSKKNNLKVIVRLYEENGGIIFEVKDNGTGMDYEVKKKIFTTFFTTKGTRGSGIGLLTTRKIIIQHGGKIEIESKKGKGSVFRVIFPRKNLNKLSKLGKI